MRLYISNQLPDDTSGDRIVPLVLPGGFKIAGPTADLLNRGTCLLTVSPDDSYLC